jgi:beta-D-xylosidase 4
LATLTLHHCRAKDNVAAIVSAGYGGQYGGQGIADVITGAYNPGGALSFSWHTEKFAKITPYDSMEMRPNKSTTGGGGGPPVGRTYRYLDTGACPDCVSWHFGFGLSVSAAVLLPVDTCLPTS